MSLERCRRTSGRGDVTAFVVRFDGVLELFLARSGVITRTALAGDADEPRRLACTEILAQERALIAKLP